MRRASFAVGILLMATASSSCVLRCGMVEDDDDFVPCVVDDVRLTATGIRATAAFMSAYMERVYVPGQTLSVASGVIESDGRPLPAVLVRLRHGEQILGSVLTDTDGRYDFRWPKTRGLDCASVETSYDHPRTGESVIDRPSCSQEVIEGYYGFRLTLEGVAEDERGPLPHATVVAFHLDEQIGITRTDGEGRYKLSTSTRTSPTCGSLRLVFHDAETGEETTQVLGCPGT